MFKNTYIAEHQWRAAKKVTNIKRPNDPIHPKNSLPKTNENSWKTPQF